MSYNQGNYSSECLTNFAKPSPLKKQSSHCGNPVKSPQNRRMIKGNWSSSGSVLKVSPRKTGGPKQPQSHASAQMLFKPRNKEGWHRPAAAACRDQDEIKLYSSRTNLFQAADANSQNKKETEYGCSTEIETITDTYTRLGSAQQVELAITDSRPGTRESTREQCGYDDADSGDGGSLSPGGSSTQVAPLSASNKNRTRNGLRLGPSRTSPFDAQHD